MARRRTSTSRSRSSRPPAVLEVNNPSSRALLWGIAVTLAVLTVAIYAPVGARARP